MPTHDPDEPRAVDLLPPDDPPEDTAPKRIAERRVVGWAMSNRLVHRREWRPVGNSKRFWKKIEEDDPFVSRPRLRRLREDHTLYPTDRLDRIPGASTPPSKPKAQSSSTPEPKRATPKPAQRAPQQTHTPDPRALQTMRKKSASPSQPVDRTPPIIPPKGAQTSRAGRIRVSRASGAAKGGTGMIRDATAVKQAAQVRAEKIATRQTAGAAVPPPTRNLDEILGILGDLQAAQQLHDAGVEGSSSTDIVEEQPNRPKPRRPAQPAAKPAPPVDRTPPKPKPPASRTPPAAAAPVDRTPPKPSPPKQPDRSPPKPGGGSGGGLNDLFGGGPNEGRVRIGKRTKPAAKTEGDEQS